jgi:myo-inositol-1(or 4)-monophosphatase
MLSTAIRAAREAGAFLKHSVGKVKHVEMKKDEERNLVSEIDKASEAMIIRTIKEKFPDHAILAEESGGTQSTAEYTWVIDPLDGTTNFLHRLPIFSVTIGIEWKGEIIAGVVYDPNADELFTAERGSGAFLNGTRLHVSHASRLIESLVVTGFPYNISDNPDHAVERFEHFLMECQGIRRLGSAALDLCYVAAGRFDGFWEVSLNPWDMAAGILIVKEAGGQVTDFSGGAASIYKKQILASNAIIHQSMLQVLQKVTSPA